MRLEDDEDDVGDGYVNPFLSFLTEGAWIFIMSSLQDGNI